MIKRCFVKCCVIEKFAILKNECKDVNASATNSTIALGSNEEQNYDLNETVAIPV